MQLSRVCVQRAMTKADLERDLMNKGFSAREAASVVTSIFESIKEALRSGEEVNLPIGKFKVVAHNRPPLRGWFLNRVRTTYKKRRFVRFTPASCTQEQ